MRRQDRPFNALTFLALLPVATVFLLPSAYANDSNSVGELPAFTPNALLKFNVPRVREEVRIDGRLDDPIWKNAVRLDNFCEIEPGEMVRPAVVTETFVAYDAENLYVGFICHDDPSTVRANVSDRDAIFQDDFVGVVIDTFRDKQTGYEFFVNPYGIQADLRRNQNNEDTSYDTVWNSGGKMTEAGWTAEMAIPFRSLRFPDADVQSWGIHFLRIRPRDSREQISWAPVSRDESCYLCVAGTMDGLEGVNQGKNLEVLPYALASQRSSLDGDNVDEFAWNDETASGDAGLGLKYGITSNLTLDGTYNPDFSQIEADAAQINANQTFALFFPERRPFFLEGADIFDSKVEAVYTRSINDPLYAGKITGKQNANTIGVMSALDETAAYVVPFSERSQFAEAGEAVSTIARYKRDLLTESYVGILATDRHRLETGDGSNTTAGADTRIRFKENYAFEAQLQGSYTQEPDDTSLTSDWDDIRFGADGQYTSAFDGEEYYGHAFESALRRNARHFNFQIWYEEYSPTFRAETGFIHRTNFRQAGLWSGYLFQIENNAVFERVEPAISLGRWFNFDNQRIDEWLEPSIWVRFKKQTSMWTSILWSGERFAGVWTNGIRRWHFDLSTNFSALLNGGTFWRYGNSLVRDTEDPRLGKERLAEAWLNFKPTSQLEARFSAIRYRLDEMNTGAEIVGQDVGRLRLTYQFTPKLFFRLIGEAVDYGADGRFGSIDPLISYKINPFTVFFLGSSHGGADYADDLATPGLESGWRQTDRVFFVKFQYLFRV